jgi:hypothetical protein
MCVCIMCVCVDGQSKMNVNDGHLMAELHTHKRMHVTNKCISDTQISDAQMCDERAVHE